MYEQNGARWNILDEHLEAQETVTIIKTLGKRHRLQNLESASAQANIFSLLAGLYTDESPGLKVDPFVVLVLSVGFIISVVALHSEYYPRLLSRLITIFLRF